MSDSKMKVVYSISERGGKSYWTRVGVAFTNQDGSMNVKLECLPLSGELQIRDYVPQENRETSGAGRAQQNQRRPSDDERDPL